MLQTRQLSLSPLPPSLLHSPLFFPLLNNEGWLVLIVMQAMNSLASFQVARAYSVRDLNLGGTFRLDAPNTVFFVLSAGFLFGMSCRFGYGIYYERLFVSLFANLIAARTRVHWP